ncbi:hypothetical protein BDZ45DRAFT_796480 [Acephala macrosclerotiorum]|nr:hypothetical protein BDZ45DRAFT_796480 [Acephala macrosclerotiorum]
MQQMLLTTGVGATRTEPYAKQEVYLAWYSLVENYCSRVLTYPDKDKLADLLGITKAFFEKHQDILGSEYSGQDSYVYGNGKTHNYDVAVIRGRRQTAFPVNDPWSQMNECAITLRGLVISSDEMSKNGRNVLARPDPDQLDGGPPANTCYLRLCVARKLDDGYGFIERRWVMIYPLEEQDPKVQDRFRRLGILVAYRDFLFDRTTKHGMLQLV